ncbi:MAG: SUF system NifU family Fe-S cluster assembly protein [Slackia faecicanis]|nr:SUF system NifU family Fe-S cluster assembly protein [Slackia faecicanis]
MASIYTAALMQHHAHPDYKYDMEDATHAREGVNPSCGDRLTLSLRIEDGTVEEAAFSGSGCAVSQASADIMADLISGESVDEARRLCRLFIAMVRGESLSDDDFEDLDEAAQLESIARMPARVKCAELAWRTLETLLDETDDAS